MCGELRRALGLEVRRHTESESRALGGPSDKHLSRQLPMGEEQGSDHLVSPWALRDKFWLLLKEIARSEDPCQ